MAMIEDTRTVAGTAAFRHEALLYAGPDGFLDGALPFVRAALHAEEPILVMVGPAKIDLLCEALGGDARDIAFADMQEVGANPARIIPAWRDFVDERGADLVLAVNEVATNSVLHGGGEGDLLVWIERDAVVCELRDSGRFDHPLAGRVRPEPGRVGGHGLWLANQVCDLVQVRSFPTGTVVRLHLRRS